MNFICVHTVYGVHLCRHFGVKDIKKKMFASGDGHIKKLLHVLTRSQYAREILQLPFDLDYVEFKIEKKIRSKSEITIFK